uniref:hemicentin-1 isoform X5 n=1 Tax=Gasterosteus aculeatus aculeatus TaxID=481459 RepID=UPI001A98E75F|nr:hemicentin-1 isoform X5 [Gasterosteus aculeatus aculeatus]
MEAVIGLFVMILGVSHGVETHCDGRQNGAQCFGALGGTLVLQLMDKASEIHKYQWSKNRTIILEGRNNAIVFNRIENKLLFTPSNGTLRINNLIRTDGGEYKLETFGSDGKSSGSRVRQLTIQAPVSSVLLVHECLSHGERKVSCSSEGADSPQYSWTLDGDTLTDSQLLGGNKETNIITLKQHVSGRLVCSVRNDVSSHSKEETVSTCGVETHCDGRQNGAQCFGVLGGTLVLQLMDKDSEIQTYQWIKNGTTILNMKNNAIVYNMLKDRSFFTPSNGTLRINNLSRADGGEYKLDPVGSDGKSSGSRVQQLTIQAPVSSVLLVHECLSHGERKVSCSSGGADSPQYSWTLDGDTLTDSQLLGRNNETNIITLKQHVSGRLVCSVRNDVSSHSKEETVSTCGVETHCDGRQNGAQCFGALGGTLVLQLRTKLDKASEIYKYQWSKNRTIILEGNNNKTSFNRIENRLFFTPSNGTLRINNLIRTDGGEYKLETFGLDGKTSDSRVQQLTIQAPVSSVLLVHECLSHGERKVSCSSGGADSPQYSWTLDGDTLTDSQLLGGNNETNIITLKQHVSGRLVCSVRNDVSSHSKEETVSTCGFIFINCTSADGTHISQWVFAANNYLCIETTTASPTNTPTLPDGKESGITESTVRNDVSSHSKEETVSTCGVETHCDGRQNGAQCFGALGGTLVLQLMDKASEIHKYQWSKNGTIILEGRNNKTSFNRIENRSLFTPSDGIFRINNLIRTDGGEYKLETFGSDGKTSGSRVQQLTIQVGSLTTAVCVLAVLVILLVVGVSVVCALKKKRENKPKEEDNQELTYSEVRIGPRPGRQMKQRAEEEVEYGEVKFSQRPRHNVEPAADECVYAKVRRER